MDKRKRSVRRHHEERIKDKFRQEASWHRNPTREQMTSKLVWFGVRTRVLDPDWRRKLEEWIEREAVRRAHHPRHYCQMCRLPRSRDERHKEKQSSRSLMDEALVS